MAYFDRLGPDRFRPTEHVSGAWDESTQHIGPALGLLVHAVELDLAARRDDPMVVSRLSYELLGVVPMDAVDVRVEVIRPGRTIELVEVTYGHGDRTGIRLRAWLQQPRDTEAIAGRSDVGALSEHRSHRAPHPPAGRRVVGVRHTRDVRARRAGADIERDPR